MMQAVEIHVLANQALKPTKSATVSATCGAGVSVLF
jgi:hypothetical protein